MIGAIMGIGGALMGALKANSASNQSWQRQHQLMEIQAELNQKMLSSIQRKRKKCGITPTLKTK